MTLLTLFVSYWNYSTYTQEKNKLKEDVEIQLQLAYTEVKDNELIVFITSQLSDSVSVQNFPDSVSIFLKDHPFFPAFPELKTKKTISELKPGQLEPDTNIILDFNIHGDVPLSLKADTTKEEIMVIASTHLENVDFSDLEEKFSDSAKFEFKINRIDLKASEKTKSPNFPTKSSRTVLKKWMSSSDSLNRYFNFAHSNDSRDAKNDSFFYSNRYITQNHASIERTYTLFEEKLKQSNLPSNFVIVDNPNSKPNGLRITYKTNALRFPEWNVDLQNHRPYLLKKMMPTLIFSLLLLGMIGLAFWTLLTNWIKQNRLVKVKNEFINNMTHELKTPIATVGVALEAISNFDLEKEQIQAKEYIDISRNEVQRLSLLVDKVLNIATFDSNTSDLASDSIDLHSTMKDTLQSMKLQFENRNAEVVYSNDADNASVKGDKLHLTNVIHNILDNALKYSLETPKINIHLSDNDRQLKLTIRDNGKGIPKAYQSKIFDRFFRVPTDDRHDVKGHGLGLNYVQNVILKMGGKIIVDSKENEGSTFTIILPKKGQNV